MKNAMEYLAALKANNNREWYREHKDWYTEANAAFERFVGALALAIAQFDPGVLAFAPKDITFKLTRDTRFSRDKSPFNPKFRAHISAGGKLPIPVGYYIVVAPDGASFLGGGLFASMFKDATTRIRDAIVAHGGEFERIVAAPDFASRFTVEGEALQKVPPGYDAAHPQAAWLKFKSWYIEHHVPDGQATGAGFVERAAAQFRAMKPFNDFLNRALEGFQMPAMPK